MIEHIQAVIFDIDGTLVDSIGMWHEIDIEYFNVIEAPMPPTIQKDIEGMSFTEVAVYFKENFDIADKSIDDIKSKIEALDVEDLVNQLNNEVENCELI